MVDYTTLRIRKDDKPVVRAEKKRVSGNLLRLRSDLRAHLRKDDDDEDALDTSEIIRLATWNIREFDSNNYGNRVPESFHYIAEIISQFDLVALQEVRRDLNALIRLMKILGPDWSYIATDVTEGRKGNKERMAFVFNRRKVWFRKVAGELALADSDRLHLPDTFHMTTGDGIRLNLPAGTDLAQPADINTKKVRGKLRLEEPAVVDLPSGTMVSLPDGAQLVFGPGKTDELNDDETLSLGNGRDRSYSKAASIRIPPKDLKTDALQFARSPFGVIFQAGWLKLMLCTVHIYYGDEKGLKLQRRNEEIRALTKMLADRARDEVNTDADNYFFVLGDFNIVGKNHSTWDSLHENDFRVPEALSTIPKGSNVDRSKAYDQIAVWHGKTSRRQDFRAYTKVDIRRAGIFDFFKSVYRQGADDPDGADEAFYEKVIRKEQPRFAKKLPVKRWWAYRTWRTYQISDHLPMWVELRVDFSDSYLQGIVDAPDPEPE